MSQTYFIIKADYFGETSILKRKTTSTIAFEPTLSQKWQILCTLESWPIGLKAQESKLSPCIQVHKIQHIYGILDSFYTFEIKIGDDSVKEVI